MSSFLDEIKQAKKTCIICNNLKKVHYDFGNGREMAEEYNLDTSVVTRRAWKIKSDLRDQDKWHIELGDPEAGFVKDDQLLIKESSCQPVVSRRGTRINLEWRIRNLSYPIETYSVTADLEKNALVVRTTNKKYFKVLIIPELKRLGLVPQQENVQITHKFNTLVITYKKPQELVEFEKLVWEEVSKLKPKNYDNMDCKPS